MAILPMDAKYFPNGLRDEHHQMIVIDLRCGKNSGHLALFLNETKQHLIMRYKWVFVSTSHSSVSHNK